MAKKTNPAFRAELLDELIAGQDSAKVLEFEGLAGDLKKALADRMLGAEMDVHLADEAEQAAGNHRNGTSPKTVRYRLRDGKIVLRHSRETVRAGSTQS